MIAQIYLRFMALKLCLVAELRVPDGRIIQSLQISSMAILQINNQNVQKKSNIQANKEKIDITGEK